MTASPDRVLARVVLTASALTGMLLLLALELLILSAGPASLATFDPRCLIAPVSSLDTAIHVLAVSLVLLASLPMVAGARAARRARARVAELRTLANTARLETPPRAMAAAAAAGLTGRIDVVDAARPFAFAYGWIWPRVCMSSGLVDLLTDRELAAVMHHEGWLVARRDPLRLLLAKSAAAAFGVVPEIQRLARHYAMAVEVAADRHAIVMMGSPRWLAGAMVKTMAPPLATPAFGGNAELRVAALTGASPATPRWRGRIALALIAVEIALLAPLLTNGSIVSLIGLWMHPSC